MWNADWDYGAVSGVVSAFIFIIQDGDADATFADIATVWRRVVDGVCPGVAGRRSKTWKWRVWQSWKQWQGFFLSIFFTCPLFYWSLFLNRMILIDHWRPSGFMFLNKIRTKNEQHWLGVWCHDQRRGRRRRSINNIIGAHWIKSRNGIQRMNFEGRLSLMFELDTLEFSSLLCHGFLPSFSRDSYAVHFTVFFFF